jgi:hypothetical protein
MTNWSRRVPLMTHLGYKRPGRTAGKIAFMATD